MQIETGGSVVDNADAEPDAAAAQSGPQAGGSERAAALRDLLATRRRERHAVVIQDFPDPDALSSALAYREIATAFDIDADILHEGLISHPENLALVNLLDLDVTRYEDGMELDRYDAAVFVDNQGATTRLTPRLAAAGVRTLAVIDHHDPTDLLNPVFSDVRPVGAAATLFAEYLCSGVLLQLERIRPRHVQLATALMHGLHSETDRFVHAGGAEYEAAAYLSRFVDAELLQQVLCIQRSRGAMDTIQIALARRTLRGGVVLSGVGYIRWTDRDAIPQATDFLLTEENVHTAIVYGILRGEDGREVVSGSLRTSNATLGVDAFLKRALGTDLRGRHYGGGRSRAGGFEIELGFLAGGDERDTMDAKWHLFDRQLRRKLFYAAGLEEIPEERSAEADEG